MIVLVTGATGVLGSRLVVELLSRAHAVRAMTRSPDTPFPVGATRTLADLDLRAGLPDAVDGVDAIVHCATSRRRHRQVDDAGTAALLRVAERAGVGHIVFPGVVGCDVVPLPFYRSKLAAEETVEASAVPWTTIRSTDFHQSVWRLMTRLARPPLMVVPHDTRFQPLDPTGLGIRLADLVDTGPSGRLPDLGGPTAYDARDLARSYLAATGKRRRIIRFNRPGIAGAALRAGANLTPNRDDHGENWNDFVARQISRGSDRTTP